MLLAIALAPALGGQEGIRFRDVSESSGLEFALRNHPTPEKRLVETMAGGVAALDFDGDGRADLFFPNGAAVPSLEKESGIYWNRLYRNLGGFRFADVTGDVGLQGQGYCTGAAAADYDNDGDADLFVACVNGARLYRNDGGNSFSDVTGEAGVRATDWPISGAWLDYDGDGHLDLFVVQYLQWSLDFDTYCGDPRAGVRSYCDPALFDGYPNQLWRNLGDGSFRDVSSEAGIAGHVGKGMSAAVADYDRDGHPDIFVTNDKVPNFLFRNRGDGTFDETALLAGAALQDHGKAVSGMGVVFADAENDGWPDVLYTALAGETYPLFRNDGSGRFRDRTYQSGLARLTHALSGWGIALVDFDNDGFKDLFTANSHVNDTVEHFSATSYKLRNAVFANAGDGTFRAVQDAGFGPPKAYRGSAVADFDGDGRVDIVVTALGERAEVLRNVTDSENDWLAVELVGTSSNRDGFGAVVQVGQQWVHATSSVGYASSNDGPLHFGLARHSAPVGVTIRWPSGTVQTLHDVAPNRILRVTEP